jgi:hypothetical protein
VDLLRIGQVKVSFVHKISATSKLLIAVQDQSLNGRIGARMFIRFSGHTMVISQKSSHHSMPSYGYKWLVAQQLADNSL